MLSKYKYLAAMNTPMETLDLQFAVVMSRVVAGKPSVRDAFLITEFKKISRDTARKTAPGLDPADEYR